MANADETLPQASVPEGKYVVPALAQGLMILSLFGRDAHSLTAPEIAQKLGLSRTTVFRLLHTCLLYTSPSPRDS